MELDELIMLTAAPIYANWLHDFQQEARAQGKYAVPSAELTAVAMKAACKTAHMLWMHAYQEAKNKCNDDDEEINSWRQGE